MSCCCDSTVLRLRLRWGCLRSAIDSHGLSIDQSKIPVGMLAGCRLSVDGLNQTMSDEAVNSRYKFWLENGMFMGNDNIQRRKSIHDDKKQ